MDKLAEWTGDQPPSQRMIEPRAIHERPSASASAPRQPSEPASVCRRPPSPPVAPPEMADGYHVGTQEPLDRYTESDSESVLTEEQEERLKAMAYELPMAPREDQEEADQSLAEMMSG